METLGDKIKQLRQGQKDLTQEALADILQVDRSTLASWEVNRREPDIVTLCRIASFFNVSVDWLVGYETAKKISPAGNGLIQETAPNYPAGEDQDWRKVIATAQQYGVKPDIVRQLIELHAKISLKNQD